MTVSPLPCPLCDALESDLYFEDRVRAYLRCRHCRLVFVPADDHLSLAGEKAVYDLHENSPEQAGYRRFLRRLLQPMHQRLPSNSAGLDFGSGPGPTLSPMFRERGHSMVNYDPLYAADSSRLEQSYDFVTASEVWEHLRTPRQAIATQWRLLNPGAWLGVMTKLVLNVKAFSTWHYKQDPTHVSFFSVGTFRWLAKQLRAAELVFIGQDVMLLRKSRDACRLTNEFLKASLPY